MKNLNVLALVMIGLSLLACDKLPEEADKAVDRAFTKQLIETGVKADLLKGDAERPLPPSDGDEDKPPVDGIWDGIKPPNIGDGGDINHPPIDGDWNDDGEQDWGNGSNIGNGGDLNNDLPIDIIDGDGEGDNSLPEVPAIPDDVEALVAKFEMGFKTRILLAPHREGTIGDGNGLNDYYNGIDFNYRTLGDDYNARSTTYPLQETMIDYLNGRAYYYDTDTTASPTLDVVFGRTWHMIAEQKDQKFESERNIDETDGQYYEQYINDRWGNYDGYMDNQIFRNMQRVSLVLDFYPNTDKDSGDKISYYFKGNVKIADRQTENYRDYLENFDVIELVGIAKYDNGQLVETEGDVYVDAPYQ